MARRLPDATSKTRLAGIVAQSKRRVVPFERGFFRRSRAQDPPPPLARLLRGGRGGEVRLKVYMSILLICVKRPHKVTRQPSSWAALLSLDDPHRNGARRVSDAIKWLEANGLIATEPRAGGPAEITLLSQLGAGEPYVRPTPAVGYANVPVELWENGWIVTLSAAALAMLLIITDMQAGKLLPAWLVPAEARDRYAISADTWTKGTRELADLGLLAIGREPQGDDWIWNRLRNTYALIPERFKDSPPVT